MNKFFLGTLIILLIGTTSLIYESCSKHTIVHQKFPDFGEVVHVNAVQSTQQIKTDKDYKNVLVFFLSGGRTVFYEDEANIEFFSSDDDKPFLTIAANELMTIHNKTNCSENLIKYLENAYEGDALFCNYNLDLEKIARVRLVRPKKRSKVATSYSVEFVKEQDDLIAVSFFAE